MANRLEEIVETFNAVDEEVRLELLLDYARKLPALPARFHAERDAGLHRVPECMSPVFLWIESDGGAVHFFVDVADEAPTVKGFLSVLLAAFEGADPAEVATVPADLIHRLGLTERIRMNRAVGLGAIIGRIRRRAEEMAQEGDKGTEGQRD